MSTENVPATPPTPETKVTFDDAQQAFINTLIKSKQGEAAAEVRKQLADAETERVALRATVEELRTKFEGSDNKGDKKGEKAEFEKLLAKEQAELGRLKSLLEESGKAALHLKEENRNILKMQAIGAAASKNQFIDNSLVTKVTADSVKWDDSRGRFIVVGDDGQTERMNSSFQPMSLEEFYAEFASKNPFLVRAGANGGTGSTEQTKSLGNGGKFAVEQIFGKNSNPALANELARTNKQEYHRLKAIAKANGVIH